MDVQRLLRAGLLSALFPIAFSACGHLKTPVYRSAGSYQSPDQYVQNDAQARHTPPNYIPGGAFRLYWPVSRIKVNRGYRPPTDRRHVGIDLGGRRGTPILAAHEGIVIYTGSDFRGYGKMVIIEYSQQWATLYAHLDEITVRQGQPIRPGEPIGAMGRTGAASGVHLHFELMKNRQPIDPLTTLPARAMKVAHNPAD